MHLPSRGLRLSATTMRYTGVFFVPTRFMRIFTDINFSKEHENYRRTNRFASLVFRKIGCQPCQSQIHFNNRTTSDEMMGESSLTVALLLPKSATASISAKGVTNLQGTSLVGTSPNTPAP